MIEVEKLVKRYGDVVAVDGVSFRVEKGEVMGFLGPNGAGKTTTMRILACYFAPTSGSARLGGFDVVTQSLQARRILGYMPENVPLYHELRVEEYLSFRAKLKGVPWRERRKRIQETLDRCGILDVRRKIIGGLSKGYRQRVGLAESLVHQPAILILDEPTIGLDPAQIREIRQLIKELGATRTVLLSTHILPEVEMVCSRILIINQGRLVASGTPGGIASEGADGYAVHVELKGTNAAAGESEGHRMKEELGKLPEVRSVHWEPGPETHRFTLEVSGQNDIREAVSSLASARAWSLRELGRRQQTLEDVYVRVVAKEGPVV